jgi:hypothetical protein
MDSRGLLLVALAVALGCVSCGPTKAPEPGLSFEGNSNALKRTQIVPTLDTPLPERGNAIWCASFLAAWKVLQADVCQGSVVLADAPPACSLLNQAADPRLQVPPETLYAVAGFEDKGVLDKIRRELPAKFPGKAPPTFPGIGQGSFVAYAYLQAQVDFGVPYFQARQALQFTEADGQQVPVYAFGIRMEDDYAYDQLRTQPRILYTDPEQHEFRGEALNYIRFAVDLDGSSSPSQIIVACLERRSTLAAMLADLEAVTKGVAVQERLGPRDVLLIPNLFYRVTHHFTALEHKAFQNPVLAAQQMDVAQQDIQFKLARSGAELRSESKSYCKPPRTDYVLDRPFLIVMRKRGVTQPYFVMWVDNAELLQPWK